MTAADETNIIDAFHAVFGGPTYTPPRDLSPAAFEDEDTLRRSRGGLSRHGRRADRSPRIDRPTEPWQDELAAVNPNWREAS